MHRKNRSYRHHIFLLLGWLLLYPLAGLQAQKKAPAPKTAQDSLQQDSANISKLLTKRVDTTQVKSDTSVAVIIAKIEGYTLLLNQMMGTLKRGYDTEYVHRDLPLIDSSLHVIKNNLASLGATPNVHDLYTNKVMLVQLQRRLNYWQEDLEKYNDKLVFINDTMQHMRNDSSIRSIPAADTLSDFYVSQLTGLILKYKQVDTLNKQNLLKIGLLQNLIANRYIEVTNMLDDTEFKVHGFGERMFNKDYTYLWEPPKHILDPHIIPVLKSSIAKNLRVLTIFFSMQWPVFIIWLLVAGLFAWWTFNNIRRIRKHHPETEAESILHHSRVLYRFPVASTLIFITTLSTLLSVQYPILYTEITWGISIVAVSYVIRQQLPKHLFRYWLLLVGLLFIYSLNNLLIRATYTEQWGLFIGAVLALLLGRKLQRSIRAGITLPIPKYSKLVVKLFIILSAVSLFLVLIARANASKIIGSVSVVGITMAVNLAIFVELLLEALYLQVEANKNSSSFISFMDYQNIQARLKTLLYVLASVAWLSLMARNLYIYDQIYEGITTFLSTERKLGNNIFTFSSVIIFLLVIWISTVAAQLIAYLVGDTGQSAQPGKKNKIGSAMLLIRLAVLALGILLAFAASGIPMDKVAIVVGALGVGIGFGLQNIVNNLVSGVILAFEKPIEVGDTIEVGVRTGIVKEIGIRSSKISAFDGSELIVPNGDLISQQLINWTHSDRTRRVELIIGVNYGSDVKQVMDILKESLQGHEGILSNPEPVVFLFQFGDNSVNFRVFFWISDLALTGSLQSDVMALIYQKLQEAGIEISYPQRDLHIRSVDPNILKQWQGRKAPPENGE